MEHYRRSLLTPLQQKIYDVILNAMLRLQPTARIQTAASSAITFDDVHDAYHAILYDQPMVFPIDRHAFSFTLDSKEVVCNLVYLDPPSVAAQKARRIEQIVRSVVEPLKGKRDLEKALALHDYLSHTVTYGYPSEKQHAFTIEGALLDHAAVCGGISRAYMLLCQRAGLRAMTASGRTKDMGMWSHPSFPPNEPHAWNIIWIDGRAYHVDVTWDPDCEGHASRTYFGISEKRRRIHIIPNPDVPLPPCPSSMLQMPYCETRRELLDAIRRFVSENRTYFQIAISWQYDTTEAFGKDLLTVITPQDREWYNRIIHYYYNMPAGVIDFVLR